MKKIILIFLVNLLFNLKLHSQNCIDTVKIKGYYVVKMIASEFTPKVKKNGKKTIVQSRMDVHIDPSFIPCDSISDKRPLSYWINHFFDDTNKAFISCERVGIKYLLAKECSLQAVNNTCRFPVLKSKILYQTTNLNTGDVFEIYYLDAYWAKLKIKKGTIQETMIPSRIAERCISPSVTEFDLYYFIKYDKLNTSPPIKDMYMKVWKK
jgi:hypothetical protein